MIMRRRSIDHILRSAAAITGQHKFVLGGSAAVIARSRHIPLAMMYTPEIDIYAPEAEDVEFASERIDGSLGQGSQFHNEFGYYGDGVSPATAKMPDDWRERAIEYRGEECPGVVAIVPEENDIALAKLAAWRDKDQARLKEGLRAGLLSFARMEERLTRMPKPNAGGNPPNEGVLKERLLSLAPYAGVAEL
jgi:hypothetical protein